MQKFTSAIKPKNETWISHEFQKNPLLTWRWAVYDMVVIFVMVLSAIVRIS